MSSRAILILVAVLVAVAVFAAQARAQGTPPTIRTELSHQRQYVDSALELRVVIDGVTDASPIGTLELDGADVQFRGGIPRSSRFTQRIGGQVREVVSNTYTLIYRITPRREGVFDVPSIDVSINGVTARSRPVSFESIALSRPEEFRLVASMAQDSVYVNEPVELELVWYLGEQASQADFSRIELPAGFRVIPYQDPSFLDRRGQRDARLTAVAVFDDAATLELGSDSIDGRRFSTATLRATLVPTAPGAFDLGPFTVSFNYTDRDRRSQERGEVVSNALSLEARPHPEAGRPDQYNGLIGRHSIESRLDRTDANVGDPIELSVRITGDNPFSEFADGPDLARIPGFSDRFRTDTDGWTLIDSPIANQWLFSTTIRPLSGDVDEFPAIALPWFDPETGEYAVARSEAIPLTIRETRTVTSESAIMSGASPIREALTDGDDGLWAINPDPLASTRALPGSWLEPGPAFWGVVAGPPACVAAAMLVLVARGRKDTRLQHARRAIARAERRVQATRDRNTVARELLTLAAALLERPERAVAAADVRAMARRYGLDSADTALLGTAASAVETHAYGNDPDAVPDSATPEQIIDALRRVRTGMGAAS